MRAAFTKYGPAHDYRWAHCTLTVSGRTLLGQITDIYRSDARGMVHVKVRYMNGETWPIEPALSALEILERQFQPPE